MHERVLPLEELFITIVLANPTDQVRDLFEFCIRRNLAMTNTFFHHKYTHNGITALNINVLDGLLKSKLSDLDRGACHIHVR